jgi:hypothetical protein
VLLATPRAAGIDQGLWEGLVEVVTGADLPELTCRTEGCLGCTGECSVAFTIEPAPAA